MGLLIAGLVLAPLIGAAGVLDWRAKRRRRMHRRPVEHRGATRDLNCDPVIGDIGDAG